MLKIDVDDVHRRSRFELQRIMYSLPCPFFVRVSSSGKGFHIAAPAGGEWDWQRYAYDDQMRIDLDTQREHHRLPVRNLLWDCKNGLQAREWRVIRTEQDIEHYIDTNKPQNIYAQIACINMAMRRGFNQPVETPLRGAHRHGEKMGTLDRLEIHKHARVNLPSLWKCMECGCPVEHFNDNQCPRCKATYLGVTT